MLKISIILPIYNVQKYLSKCLDSVVNQTYQNLEIICVNDGSTDNSLQILEEYAQKDKRIKIINQKNQGVSVARNKGYFYLEMNKTNPSIFFATAAETGIIGIVLYLLAFFQLYFSIDKLKPYLNPKERTMFWHFKITIIVYIVSSVYDSNIYNAFTWIYFGIIIGLLYKLEIAKQHKNNIYAR